MHRMTNRMIRISNMDSDKPTYSMIPTDPPVVGVMTDVASSMSVVIVRLVATVVAIAISSS